MKKMKFLLLLFVVYCLSSCQKDPLYSCDPSIEKWASENLSAINRLDREQLLNLGNDSYRKAAYRGFSSEKKQKIWKEKYLELKKLNWSKAEWEHIDLIYSLVLDDKISIINSLDVENDDELLKFIYRWQEHASEVLGWNKKQIFAICYSIGEVINKQGDLALNYERNNRLVRTEPGAGFECSCSQVSSYCDILDHEGPDYTTCRTPEGGGCKKIPGCGLFWQFECTGMCLGLNV